jgi:hypothetical protein
VGHILQASQREAAHNNLIIQPLSANHY